ncbi:hypothetical protein PPYR_11961 [Photinus pyralis]|uniref:Nucleosome-remodeling factor subunit NURF301 n=2 Tax=Photinus pyralis TaxID=7054 RepID=A0A1Y1MKS7_PHOPY|nr:nucleosome-remodeling factor subunit NURF301 isoform X3 [Photinus pyralis]KAB0795122.1 hypothetical protein PPYR_11961 [Photinus pyralis]
MSTRGVKKRGRPPKIQVAERAKKFQYQLLKKPKYLQNLNKGSDSQSSTPTTSRPCSPQEYEVSKRNATRTRARDGHRSSRKGGLVGSAYPRRGYNPNADYHDSEYHYGSDFGDESSDNKSDIDDELGFTGSDSGESVDDGDRSSDSDFSLSSYSTLSGTPRRTVLRPPSPEPLWLQNRELPPLVLPKSSEDLLISSDSIMAVVSIYEVLRHFRNLVRLSPFRLEDFCAALLCDDQNALLAEIHIMLLRALLREEDSQQTHFGPLDQKDSINITIFLIDNLTYSEVLRSYIEGDKNFDSEVLNILTATDYPFTTVQNRIKVLHFLTDLFLTTNPVREDLLSEVPMHYDDHCRVCHKLGDLLCCETCPAVYHLECVDPPLTNVPEDDWQCGICRSHKVSGVVDCVLDVEKQGQLCRQECLGCDRHGRKYYFLCRRIFVESEDGEIWYYTTSTQLDELLNSLDPNEMEASLCHELNDYKDEILRQMDLTEKLTNQFKGNKKSYLEVENARILQVKKEQEEKLEEERKEKERQAAEDMVAKMHEDPTLETDVIANNLEIDSTVSITTSEGDVNSGSNTQDEEVKMDEDEDGDQKKEKENKLKISSIVQKVTIDNLRRKTLSVLNRDDLDKKELETSRMTRLKSSQIANGTYLYKLGMDNQCKSYVNQYTTNPIALNKPQRNEERDKRRHLSHKFSLTTASEFKWIGAVNGSRTLLLNTLRQTILQLEQTIQTPFMHPNWNLIRKHWLVAMASCQKPKDFARAIIVLQTCMKPVIFANVWHEQLGHTKLSRTTAIEREERKKIEKREKKERDEEEERNRMMVTGYVKYTMGFKHQLWKQKGEEYRIHGRWGWLWLSSVRNLKTESCLTKGLAAGPSAYMVQIRDSNGLKILKLNSNAHAYLLEKFPKDVDVKEEVEMGGGGDCPVPSVLQNLRVVPPIDDIEELDVSKALTINGRLLFPKVAHKSVLDDLLARRLQLKTLEERKIAQLIKTEEPHNEDEVIDVDSDDADTDAESNLEKQLNNMMSGKVVLPPHQQQSQVNKEMLNTIAKKIQALRLHYTSVSKFGKDYQCYSKGCNTNSSTLLCNCYSPLCLQRNKVRKELLALLKRANFHTNVHSSLKLPNILGIPAKKSILEQKLSAPPTVKQTEPVNETQVCKELMVSLKSTPHCKDETITAYVKKIFVPPPPIKIEKQSPVKMEVDPPPEVFDKTKLYSDSDDVDMEGMTPDAINEMIIGSSSSGVRPSVVKTEATKAAVVDGIVKRTELDVGRTIQTLNARSSSYVPQPNRRFCTYKTMMRKEEKVVKAERAEDGTERIYTTISTEGKVYLKKLPSTTVVEKRKKRQTVKYPLCSTFQTNSGSRSLLVLPKHEVQRLARSGGKVMVSGFHHLAKPNNFAWPYPCARPLFKTCWLYRTVNLKNTSSVALLLRILWACMRWDDMQAKPPNTDGKNHITTETEILSLELLKHRYVGQFLERTQYLRRKVVIPLELPKTVREVTSIRSGLRKRKRPESPQCTDPQVTEEWVDEDKLELWEIKQYGEKIEKANVQVITRSRTGNLPPARAVTEVPAETTPTKVSVTSKATPEEIKEKMEQQLRLQRAAHQQKRALELKSPQGQIIKMVGNTAQVTTADGQMKIVKNVVMPGANLSTKSTLTSLLTANTTPTGNNKFTGRRIFMTKAADGTTRVIAGAANILPKTPPNSQSLIKVQTSTVPTVQQIQVQQPVTTVPTSTTTTTLKTAAETPQRVQIMRSPDGRLTVKGLMPGQQIVQMPDGKLQVLTTTQIHPATTAPKTPPVTSTKAIIKTANNPTGKLVLQSGQLKTVQQIQPQSPTKTQQIIVKQQGAPLVQKAATPNSVVVSGGQVLQHQVVVGGQQVITTSGQQQIVTNQIIVNNPTLAQQLATGKLQVASVNGQQVLIRPTGNGQAQVVAQITPGNIAHTAQVPQVQTGTPNRQVIQQVSQPVAQEQMTTTKIVQDNANQVDQATMEQLLIGQPPGTVIKCVTAQVIQTQQGPRIVLQGLQGADFTPQQLSAVQHQVKQQLLKAQASTGKQGVLGPTKIYLAVQPTGAETVGSPNSQPPPLAPVQQVTAQPQQPIQEIKIQTNPVQANFEKSIQPSPNTLQPTTVLQQVANGNSTSAIRQVLVNGQQSSALLQAMKANMETNQLTAVIQPPLSTSEANKQFVVTPDYIQQTIKTALKQENLNPEIEEKLLQLQRYQENKMKQEPELPPVLPRPSNPPIISTIRMPVRKRPPNSRDDDTEWVMETPKRSRFTKSNEIKKEEPPIHQIVKDKPVSPRARVKLKDTQEDEKRVAMKTKIMVALFRQKEALKKEILRKRALLERELQCEIQKEVAEEIAAQTRLERTRQDEVRSATNRRRSTTTTLPPAQVSPSSPPSVSNLTPPSANTNKSAGRPRRNQRQQTPTLNSPKIKKEKIYCVCRTPYDETRFYVGCDLCNNWFHGDCVDITEESSKTMTEFVCSECRHARDTQEIFCLCRQPYDESQFYICCDSCQDWFHGRCVGILQSEADSIDEYVCPNCQKNSSVNFANMKNLSDRDFEGLRKLIKQLQCHKSAWPFMEPVDPNEAPDYYRVIKEPMDLQKVETKITEQSYNKLSEFIGDMTKIFDNCRYYNPKESPFFKCAESLEAYFVNKIQFLREKLSENNRQ